MARNIIGGFNFGYNIDPTVAISSLYPPASITLNSLNNNSTQFITAQEATSTYNTTSYNDTTAYNTGYSSYSLAIGRTRNISMGSNSVSMGHNSVAPGDYNVVIGINLIPDDVMLYTNNWTNFDDKVIIKPDLLQLPDFNNVNATLLEMNKELKKVREELTSIRREYDDYKRDVEARLLVLEYSPPQGGPKYVEAMADYTNATELHIETESDITKSDKT